jgi:predicted metal-dependent phosphoesterase TrpH
MLVPSRQSSTAIRLAAAVAAAVLLLIALRPNAVSAAAGKRWYKGNLHTHTINSDGDSTPNDVTTWYKDHRYQFLVLTDHNYFTDIAGLTAVHGAAEKFLLIPGEEVTDKFQNKPVHVNGLNLARFVEPTHGASLVETIQGNVNAIRAASGLPSVNHPNFGWAMQSADLLRVENLGLFEVYNGHPTVNNRGGGGSESLDQMWDALLTAGRRIRGIAVDDAHYFKQWGRQFSNPGRGWVTVRAAKLTAEDIAAALAAGDFYASNGVELTDVTATASELRIAIKPAGDARYVTRFIGAGGQVLQTSKENTAVYKFRGGEKYVRAKVDASTGDEAWVQPVFMP